MIQGQFGDNGELIFEIELITGDGDIIPVWNIIQAKHVVCV